MQDLIDDIFVVSNSCYAFIRISLMPMVIEAVLLFFSTTSIMANGLLLVGCSGISIEMLIGVSRMVRDQASWQWFLADDE